MISIDVTGRAPIYEQIVRGVCSDIANGVLKENDKLPGARALAKELGLNPNTVAKAYGILERDGIIYSVSGKGCFVAKHEGRANERLTEHFRQKAREALSAGVPSDTLKAIVDEEDRDMSKGMKDMKGGNEK